MVWSWLQVLPTLPSPRTKEYAAFARRLSNGVTADTQFSGSKMFPTCLYYTHHRPGYFTSVHMNGESTLNAGAPTLFRSRMEPALLATYSCTRCGHNYLLHGVEYPFIHGWRGFWRATRIPTTQHLLFLRDFPIPSLMVPPPCAPLWCIRPFRNATECVNGEGQTSWFLADGANAAYTSSSSGTEYDLLCSRRNSSINSLSRLHERGVVSPRKYAPAELARCWDSSCWQQNAHPLYVWVS